MLKRSLFKTIDPVEHAQLATADYFRVQATDPLADSDAARIVRLI